MNNKKGGFNNITDGEHNVGSPNDKEENQKLSNDSDRKKLTTNQKILIGGFTALILVIIAVVIFWYIMSRPEPSAGNLIINKDNLEQIKDDLKTNVNDGMFLTDMTVEWTFPDGESASTDAHVANSMSNHYPINFEIILDDTGEVVYTSDVIPKGYSIKEIKLDKDLDAGTYTGVCKYHLLNEETGDEISSLSVNVTLRIIA